MTDKKPDIEKKKYKSKDQVEGFLILLLVLPLLLIFGLPYFLYRTFRGLRIGYQVKKHWYPQGKFMLFVYSDSPNWKEYIESNIVPKISSRAVILNWTEKSRWDWPNTLEYKIYKHWMGVGMYFENGRKKWIANKEYNPVAITFDPWWKREVIPFWKAFKDYKHGKDIKLREAEQKLFLIVAQSNI